MNNVQATGEAFSPPQKRTFSIWKHEISSLFLFFGSFLHSWIRIHHNTAHLWVQYYLVSPINSLGNSACRTELASYARRWSLTLRADAWENRMLLLHGTYSNFSAGKTTYHRIRDIVVGSGDAETDLWLTEDPALFVRDLQEYLFFYFFCLLLFLNVHLDHSSKIKGYKEVTKQK